MSGLSDGISPAKEEPTIEETYESEEEIFYDASEESRDYKSEWRKIMDDLSSNIEKSNELKSQGNTSFKSSDLENAESFYLEALAVLPSKEVIDKYVKLLGMAEYNENEPAASERAILHGNLSAVQKRNERLEEATENATEALRLKSDYNKVRVRRAGLFEETDKPHEAMEDWKYIAKSDSTNHQAITAMKRLEPKIEEKNERMKQEMFDGMKKLGDFCLKPFGLSTNNFKLEQNEQGSYNVKFQQ